MEFFNKRIGAEMDGSLTHVGKGISKGLGVRWSASGKAEDDPGSASLGPQTGHIPSGLSCHCAQLVHR